MCKKIWLIVLVLTFSMAVGATARAAVGCGNRMMEAGEQCDDGNTLNGDGCNNQCQLSVDLELIDGIIPLEGTVFRHADLDGDGVEDLLNLGGPYMTVLLNQNGTLVTVQIITAPDGERMSQREEIEDMNGDGKLDIVGGMGTPSTYGIYVWLGNGDGTFQDGIKISGPYPSLSQVTVADVDGDEYKDIITATSKATFTVIFMGPNLTVSEQTPLYFNYIDTMLPVLLSASVVAYDFDNDGAVEIALSVSNQYFQSTYEYCPGWTKIYRIQRPNLVLLQSFDGAPLYKAILYDLNHDGLLDILGSGQERLASCSHWTDTSSIARVVRSFSNQSDGTFSLSETVHPDIFFIKDLGDITHDGKPDLSIIDGDGSIGIYPGDGNGWTSVPYQFAVPELSSDANQVMFYDYDADSRLDVVIPVAHTADMVTLHGYRLIMNRNYWTKPVCGDNRLSTNEQCDDGNGDSGDGCSAWCQVEPSIDSDADGLFDNEEIFITLTNPLNPDTDGDCVWDGDEVYSGFDPLDPSDQPGCAVIRVPDGYWHVMVTLLDAPDDQVCDLYLTSPREEPLIKDSLKNIGKVAQTPAQTGDLITFLLHIDSTGLGLGEYDYASDSVFARITRLGPLEYLVGFESLPADLADWDYDDVLVHVMLLEQGDPPGHYVNYLGESQIFQTVPVDAITSVSLPLTLGSAVNATVTIPGAGLTEETFAILTEGNPALYEELTANAPFISTGDLFKLNLASGQSFLNPDQYATISVTYLDADDDGFVDGTAIREKELRIWHFISETGEWEPLASTVDPKANVITASSNSFSLFALGGKYPGRLDGKGSDATANSGLFGCALAAGPVPAANFLGMLLLAAGPVAVWRVSRARRKS